MERAIPYVIVGGGVAAGYAAHEFVKRGGVNTGELCIISDEHVAPYERPALSKCYLLPEAPTRLPSFHCCVGSGEENLTPEWYMENGIELILGTRVKSADVTKKLLVTTTGEVISYKYLIVATGARALKLEEFGVNGLDAANVCYIRNLIDADKLVSIMQLCRGGNAVVIGGGYIAMECAAALVVNKLNVTMVFPEAHFLARLFTSKIASHYEEFYQSKGVKIIKGTTLASFDFNFDGKVMAVNLRDGSKLPVDMVVVAVGISPNTSLFKDQLTMEKGGIKVNSNMQSSNRYVYAVGDVAASLIKLVGETRRLEHVDFARKSARHAVASILDADKTGEFNYIPVFYSRAFQFSWQFCGDNAGEPLHFDDFTKHTFGVYWIKDGHIVGSFLEGGSKEQYEAMAQASRLQLKIDDLDELERQGLVSTMSKIVESPTPESKDDGNVYSITLEKKQLAWNTIAGVVVAAAAVASLTYWYGRRRRKW